MASRYQVKGVNDDKDFCQCCGRKVDRVVWIEDTETQEVIHLGTTCALILTDAAEISKAVREFKSNK